MRQLFLGNGIDIVFKEVIEPINMFGSFIKMINEINIV